MKKIIFLIVILLTSGCSRTNPLLNQDSAVSLKLLVDMLLSQRKAGDCPAYWAGKKDEHFTQAFQALCDKEMKIDYAFLQKHQPDIIKDATFEEFKDPKLWQMYLHALD